MSAEVFYPAREKEETEKNKGRKEGEQMQLYPQSELMVIHSERLALKSRGRRLREKEEQDKIKRN